MLCVVLYLILKHAPAEAVEKEEYFRVGEHLLNCT